MRIATVIGVRPEIIKMAKLIPLLDKKFDHTLIFSGQHYSPNMVDIFFDQLEVRKPDFHINTKTSDYESLIKNTKSHLQNKKFDYVIVYGDSNTTYAGAKAATECGQKVIHIEAGLRSFDKEMPEEWNRIQADGLSSILFPPTELSKHFLIKEKINGKILVVGNTIVDVCKQCLPKARNSDILDKLGLEKNNYILAEFHRQETTDKKDRLVKILEALKLVEKKIVIPIHPRTKVKMNEFGLEMPKNVHIVEAVGYFEFLKLLENASLVMTDSGGVQEEAIILKTPCITLRDNTERWETIEEGGNLLAGRNPELVQYYVTMILENHFGDKMRQAKNPYGDGTTSEKIVKFLEEI